MITDQDVGGVHIKYLYHGPRQLWLYVRGVRPEFLSHYVEFGEAVHDTSYRRSHPVDLGAARLDDLDGGLWVHEIKSSAKPSDADRAQALHYCYRLHEIGVSARGSILHYPKVRRTITINFDPDQADLAADDVHRAVQCANAASSPPRLARPACRGCSYNDYCWTE